MTTSTKPLGEWHRIDDPEHPAPKDGRTIIICGKNYDRDGMGMWVVVGHWRIARGRFIDKAAEDPNADLGVNLNNPLYWFDLPEPPRP